MEDSRFTVLCRSLPCRMWISHEHTYVPYPLSPLPPSTPSRHGGCHRALGCAPFIIQQIPTRYLFYIWQCGYVSATLSVPAPPFKMLIYFPVLKVIWTHPPALMTVVSCLWIVSSFYFFLCYIFCFAENCQYHDYVWFSSLSIFLCYLKQFMFSWLLFDGCIIFHQKTMVCLCELANKKWTSGKQQIISLVHECHVQNFQCNLWDIFFWDSNWAGHPVFYLAILETIILLIQFLAVEHWDVFRGAMAVFGHKVSDSELLPLVACEK